MSINTENFSNSKLPLVLIDVDKHQLKPQYNHKDIVKLALCIGAALNKVVIGLLIGESVEIDKHRLKIQYDHKDAVKMALSMGAALKKLIGICRNESLDVLKNLFVVGLLIGGSEFDLCFVHPDFGSAVESDFGLNKSFPPYGMVFKYSREYWRFDIFGDHFVEMNTTEASGFIFKGQREEFVIEQRLHSSDHHDYSENHSSVDIDHMNTQAVTIF